MEQKTGKLCYTFAVGNAHRTKRASGFTMIELMIVIVVIGVLAAIALPSYRIQISKMKNQEAVRILMALWEAQKDYYRENGVYTADINDLAIDIPAPKHFINFDVLDGTPPVTCSGSPRTPLASMEANDSSYTLYALVDGRVVCKPASGGCPGSLCPQMGFSVW